MKNKSRTLVEVSQSPNKEHSLMVSLLLKTSCALLSMTIIGGVVPTDIHALASTEEEEILVETKESNAPEEDVEDETKQAKELLFLAPEATSLTVEGEETLKEHYVEKYMPVEGCSLIEELPVTSDIDYVPPKPKTKPKPKPKPEPVKEVTPKVDVKEDVITKTVVENTQTAKAEKSEVQAQPQTAEVEVAGEFAGASISMSEDERYWLEKLVEAESAGESYEGKVAVASVIANRVEMNEFPNTVMDVIRQPKQFSPFMDGSIERRTPSAETKQAVAQVFDDGIRNMPLNVGFFCTTAIAPYSWIGKNKTLLKVIGNHSFYLK